ncbi:type VII secretion protein EccE [Gordonia sp. DT30]|uniref:type VII secretion protein EccE n=1 Tax=Gordonia sp. DT30 TaxID=3416546 RepID=UPI003CE8BFA4
MIAGSGITSSGSPASARPRPAPRRATTTAPLVPALVLVEVLLALGLLIWALSGSPLGWLAPAVTAVVALTVLPLRNGTSPIRRLGRRLSFTWSRMTRRTTDLTPAPFDIPARTDAGNRVASGMPAAPPEPPIGARWAGEMLITALRVRPGTPSVTRLFRDAAVPADTPGTCVPLEILAECIDPFDIPLSSIDVVSHGSRIRGRSRPAATYLRTLGRLPAIAQRTVVVILRLDPRDCPDAVARRGGGAVGALRAATVSTRRVARRLSEHGLEVAALSAAEMTAVTDHLTAGHELGRLSEDWDGLRSPAGRMRLATIDPEMLPEVVHGIWTHPAATTLAIRLAHTVDGRLRVSGLIRLDDAGAEVDGYPGTTPLRGRQFEALTTGLPVASPVRRARRLPGLEGAAAHGVLARLTLPAGGCGQLIGADRSGTAVALPLVGPGIDLVALRATPAAIAQTVLRTVAIGTPVTIHTDNPQRWRALVGAVADAPALDLAAPGAAPRGGLHVDLYDGITPPPGSPPSGCTRFVVSSDHPATRDVGGAATITITQNPQAPQRLSVIMPRSRIEVTMVALPEEWALTGAGTPVPTHS